MDASGRLLPPTAVVLLLNLVLSISPNIAGAPADLSPPSLDLEPFEDDDCLEVPHAEVLLALMHDMCTLLEQVLWSDTFETEGREEAWRTFEQWSSENVATMMQLAAPVLGRPYCEPGKVAWMAAECLLLMRKPESGPKEALTCAAALDEDLLAQMTPRVQRYNTRLNLVLRSPWPALRLLDLLVRLHPESGTTRMGACRAFRKWNSDPDIFDWPWFKPLVIQGADTVTSDAHLLALRPEDGPLSRQYRARWLRVHGNREIRKAISFSDDAFEAYREHHYKAGCHLGVISSYVLQMLLVHSRDIEGRLQRYAASVAQLMNFHAPFSYIVQSDWPVFRLLYLTSLLQRAPPRSVWQGEPSETRAQPDAAKTLCTMVEKAVTETYRTVYVTAAWGHLARFSEPFLIRWGSLFRATEHSNSLPIIFLALDADASRHCANTKSSLEKSKLQENASDLIHCVEAPRRLGIEGAIAKYLSMATITRLGVTAVWLDLDTYVLRDPTPHIHASLEGEGSNGRINESSSARAIVFSKHLMSESISPAVVAARGSPDATDLLMKYAYWLRDNPFMLDHQGWDHFLDNHAGDIAGSFDYQGRNITIENDTGPALSFLPKGGAAPVGIKYGFLGNEFGSGDGWIGTDENSLAVFHFWGTNEPQDELFNFFYPFSLPGAGASGLSILSYYRRQPNSAPSISAFLGRSNNTTGRGGGKPLHLVSVSYAHGCCQKSLRKNRGQALRVGVDDARAYGFRDLSPAWVAKNRDILSQRRGGGWWLWKPHVILSTLEDPSVPWNRGVVLWVDAGNYLQEDPRPLVSVALRNSDIAALRLKWCLEVDWTNQKSLQQLNVTNRYAVTDRPQLGAYFLMFRKTRKAIGFVREWLHKSENPFALIGALPGENQKELSDKEDFAEVPGFQKHQADQSIFSILFKEHGFHAVNLEQGHKVIKLARWRQ